MNQRPEHRVLDQAARTIHHHASLFPSPEAALKMARDLHGVSQSNAPAQLIHSNIQSARSVLERLLNSGDPRVNVRLLNECIASLHAVSSPSNGRGSSATNHRAVTQVGATQRSPQLPRTPHPNQPSSSVAVAGYGYGYGSGSVSGAAETVSDPLSRQQSSSVQALRQLEIMKSQRPHQAPSSAVTPVRQPEKASPTDFDDDSWLDGLPAVSIKSLQSIKGHPGSGLTISKKALNAPSASTLNALARDFAPEFKAMGFRLVKQVGKGGMGVVILAKDISLDRDVAIKIITDPSEDFDLEAKLGAKFKQNDPVVYVSKAGKLSSGFPFLVMEYLENVSDLHGLDKATDPETKIGYCLGMAESVECLHEKEVLHRDLKPANFLIKGEEDGKVYASDFGLAVEFSEVENIQLTNEDGSPAIQGTPLYMSPEQAVGAVLTPAADVYSLGISMYEVLTGESPYPKNVTQHPMMMLVHLMRIKESPITTNLSVLKKLKIPVSLCALLVRMTDPNPENRPEIGEVKKAWKKHVETFSESYRRNKKLSLALKILAPLAILIGVGAYSMKRPEEYTAFGAKRQSAIAEIDSSLSNNQVNIEQLQDLLMRVRMIEQSRPEGYTSSENEPTEQSLQEYLGRVEDRVQDLESQKECRESFRVGLRSYRLGELDEARNRLNRVRELNMTGLTSDQQEDLAFMMNVLENWEQKFEDLGTEATRIALLGNIVDFKSDVDELKVRALQQDANSLTTLLIMTERLNTPDEIKQLLMKGKSLSVAISMVDESVHTRFLERTRYLSSAINTLEEKMDLNRLNPEDVGRIYERNLSGLENASEKIAKFLALGDFEKCRIWTQSLCAYIEDIKHHESQFNLGAVKREITIQQYIELYLSKALREIHSALTPVQQSTIYYTLEDRFPNDQQILSVARSRLIIIPRERIQDR